MEQSDLLRHCVETMERLGVPYFVTGSMATIFYGEPRLTLDVDIVLRLTPDQVGPFCAAFTAPAYYVSEDAARQAILHCGQFNVIHPESGLKADLIVADDSAFNRSRFERRRRVRLSGEFEASFASPEDMIVMKLLYYQTGQSHKHLRDITGMLRLGAASIDEGYVRSWAERLGIADIWNETRAAADTGAL